MATSSQKPLNNMKLNVGKAGMESVDVAKVNEIILQASRGSNYYKRQQERQKEIEEKINGLKQRLASLTEQKKTEAKSKADELAKALCAKRDLTKVIVVLDMDAFYAAVEMRDNPELANVPMAVGGMGMLSTSNYLARKYGVRAAMPGFIAKKLCPELVIVPTNFDKYTRVSKQMQQILGQYDPNFSAMSLDEAYLDITDHVDKRQCSQAEDVKTREDVANDIVNEIREKIFLETNLTCSAGIAVNTRLAKVCSNLNKPNGQYCLPFHTDKIMEFVEKLPIGKVCGVGNVTEQQLHALGIATCGDLWQQRAVLAALFSDISSKTFLRISLGLGSTHLNCDDQRKSISIERTFKDAWDQEELQQKCESLCRSLAEDLKNESIMGKTVTLKLKTATFHVLTRAKTLNKHTSDFEPIHKAAQNLLQQEIKAVAPQPLKLRLMGIRMSALLNESEVPANRQPTLKDIVRNLEKNSTNDNGFEASRTSGIPENPDECSVGGDRILPEIKTAELHPDASSELESDSCDGGGNWTCPICNRKQNAKNMDLFNRHLDECLSKKTVLEVLRADRGSCNSGEGGGGGTKRKSPRDIPSSASKKRNHTKTKLTNTRTIDTFCLKMSVEREAPG